ncbi:tail fiber domain-containing protein [Bacteriovoracaceae bacterium]|nr:tail fiber domain-containing protein [Bacteriovoracaceae bacterium]
MSKLKIASNQSGVSMVMVLMGFALAGMISVAMMKMNEVEFKRVATIEAKDERREMLKTISMVYLGNADNCLANFGPTFSNDVSVDLPVAQIVDSNGVVQVSTGTRVGKNNDVGNIVLKAFVPEDGAAGSSLNGYCDLEIEIRTRIQAGKAKAFGGNKRELIRLGCRVDDLTTPEITSCSPASSGADDAVWNLVEDGGNQYINWDPFNASGGLIIGPPSVDIMGEDTGALNMNMAGNTVGNPEDIFGTPRSDNYTHSIKLRTQGTMILPSTTGDDDIGIAAYAAGAPEDCLSFHNAGPAATPNLDHLLQFCRHQVRFGPYRNTGGGDERTQLLAKNSIFAKTPTGGTPWITFPSSGGPIDFDSHASLISVAGADPSYILSLNGYQMSGGAGYNTENIDGNGAFMMKVDTDENVIRWYMDTVTSAIPNDKQVLLGDPDLFEIARFEANFSFTFGDVSNILPTLPAADPVNHSYIMTVGERIAVGESNYNLVIGENLGTNNPVTTSNFNFIFGFTLSNENSDSFNFNFGHSNVILDGENNMIFGGSNAIHADRGGTTLIGYSHYAGDDASEATAIGEGAALYNSGEVSIGKFPQNISSPEEESIFTLGGGIDNDNRFNNALVTKDGHLELNQGSLVTYAENAPVFPTTAYIIPGQTHIDFGGARNDSWLSNNLKVICEDDGSACRYFMYNTPDNQYGFSAVRLSDNGSISFYNRSRALLPTESAVPGEVDANFLNSATAGGNQVASFSGGDVLFNVNFSNTPYTGGLSYALTVAGLATADFIPNVSDRRLKTKIRNSEVGLEELLQLKPREYVWKESGIKDFGFIAQEVQNVLPTVIDSKNKDRLGVRYQELIAPIHQALKELESILVHMKNAILTLADKFARARTEYDQERELNQNLLQTMRDENLLR